MTASRSLIQIVVKLGDANEFISLPNTKYESCIASKTEKSINRRQPPDQQPANTGETSGTTGGAGKGRQVEGSRLIKGGGEPPFLTSEVIELTCTTSLKLFNDGCWHNQENLRVRKGGLPPADFLRKAPQGSELLAAFFSPSLFSFFGKSGLAKSGNGSFQR